MRISDWSSDVCSSDLIRLFIIPSGEIRIAQPQLIERGRAYARCGCPSEGSSDRCRRQPHFAREGRRSLIRPLAQRLNELLRSEERSVGKECVRTWRQRLSVSL